MSNVSLNLSNISMKYGKELAVDNICLSLTEAKVIGLCGPNGAGKTTLIKMIVGLIKSNTGNIEVCGFPIGKESKSIVSYQPDIINLDENLTGNRALKQYPSLYPDFNGERFIELFTKLQLSLDKPLKNMSKGMKEKFQLALTLSRDAKVYIFDEPIAGVDPASRDSILDTILKYYTKDAILIISTHLISDIESILDEVIFINEGRLILHDNCDDLREERHMSIDEIFREEFKW